MFTITIIFCFPRMDGHLLTAQPWVVVEVFTQNLVAIRLPQAHRPFLLQAKAHRMLSLAAQRHLRTTYQ